MRKLFIFAALAISSLSFAHKVSIFLDKEGGTVDVYGYFSDGTPAKNSPVEVYDASSGKLLLKGKTDENGLFEFQIPKGVSELKVALYAGLGHKAVQTLKVSAGAQPPEPSESENLTAVQNKTPTLRGQNFEVEIPAGVEAVVLTVKTRGGGEEKITLRVSPNATNTSGVKTQSQPPKPHSNKTAEEEELQKIRKEVAKETAFPWQKVFCGIGWILGIFGILSFIYGGRTRKD